MLRRRVAQAALPRTVSPGRPAPRGDLPISRTHPAPAGGPAVRRERPAGAAVPRAAALAGPLGWAATLLLCVLRLRARHRIARACHEVRGPLCAARLGLETLAADPPRHAAIDLELRRAALVLDDLAGGRPTDRRELVDLCALAHAHAPAWQAVVAAHGARLRLDVITEAPAAGGVVIPLRPRQASREPGGTLLAAPARPSLGTAVFGDPLRLAQACANLVANAAEHGGDVVRIRVAAAGDRVRFEVADDGPGLPAPVGVLAAGGRTRRGRRGHGLAVAAAVAANHRGRLITAPARSGARVVIDLPAAALARHPRRAAATPPEIVA